MSETINLVLLRHGESTWNLENRFTGWTDVPLTPTGVSEAGAAGSLMAEEEMVFDLVHTSLLRRAITTANIALDAMDLHWLPVTRDWHLNERHYGALQGLNKKETAEQHSPEQVFEWRRSYATPPPALDLDDERHPRFDPRYSSLSEDEIPATECLLDVVNRMLPYWDEAIAPDVRAGKRLLIVAHGSSLRAMLKQLKGISNEDIPTVNIPTGIPLVIQLDADLNYLSDRYLGDEEEAAAAAARVAAQAG